MGGTQTQCFALWLHGLGDSGPPNEEGVRSVLAGSSEAAELLDPSKWKWSFPSATLMPVTCNNGFVMPSWFDVYEMPISAKATQKDETGLLTSVKMVHNIIDQEISSGIVPENIFVCGLSQGGALTLASTLLYPRTLGGAVIFSGWAPFNSSFKDNITPAAKQTPIFWCHGKVDRTVLFDAGKAAVSFLREAGVNCKFKVYPDLGHTLSDEELLTMASWIKGQLTNDNISRKAWALTMCSCFYFEGP